MSLFFKTFHELHILKTFKDFKYPWGPWPDNVIGAGTLNMFKNSLDRLWSKQELLYNYRASIEKSNYVY